MTDPEEEIQRRLIRIFDSFTCGVIAESNRKVVFANEKLAQMLGQPRESLFGRATFDLVPRELRSLLEANYEELEQGDLRARLTSLRVHNGGAIPVLVLPMIESKSIAGDDIRFDVVIDLGSVMTAKHILYDGEDALRSSLTKIAIDLQAASLMAGSTPAAQPEFRHPELAELTKREREVLAHLVAGDRVPAIATTLFISQHTVRNHLKSMFRKLDVSSQAELIERARELR